jgi:hypothetical protein
MVTLATFPQLTVHKSLDAQLKQHTLSFLANRITHFFQYFVDLGNLFGPSLAGTISYLLTLFLCTSFHNWFLINSFLKFQEVSHSVGDR